MQEPSERPPPLQIFIFRKSNKNSFGSAPFLREILDPSLKCVRVKSLTEPIQGSGIRNHNRFIHITFLKLAIVRHKSLNFCSWSLGGSLCVREHKGERALFCIPTTSECKKSKFNYNS